MSAADKHTIESITEIHTWTPSLLNFLTTRPRPYRFIPGLFARLGVNSGHEIV